MNNGPSLTCKPAMAHPDQARGQFFRVEKFAVQAPRGKAGGNNISKVAHEAVRTEGFCPHVEHPLAPTVLYGVGPLEAARHAEAWAQHQTADFFHKPSQTRMGRKYRADKPCALVGVISVPPEWTDGPRWSDFKKQCLDWLKQKYEEDRLRSMIEHLDERCLHLHFWVIPREEENFSAIHQGEKALDEVGRSAARIVRDAAYKAAMARLLDEFHIAVGSHFGLERETVGGTRLSREKWLHKQHLDRLRENEIQRRIDDAVSRAMATGPNHFRKVEVSIKDFETTVWSAERASSSIRPTLAAAENHQVGTLNISMPVANSSNTFSALREKPAHTSKITTTTEDGKDISLGKTVANSLNWIRPRNG